MFLAVVLFVGLMGRLLPERIRECRARFVAWLGGSITGALVRNRADTADNASPTLRDRLTALISTIFVTGILAGLASALFEMLKLIDDSRDCVPSAGGNVIREFRCHDWLGNKIGLGTLALIALPAAAFVGLLGYRVDVNLFSLHAFHRNRLARCFPGASSVRRANPLSDFDPHDDLDLAELTHVVPQPANEPALPQRPLQSGFGLPIGPLTERTAQSAKHRQEDLPGVLHLGTAMAISRAAASPNMGDSR